MHRAGKSYHIFSQAGFSLIELMVTVAIIGTLATIAVPSYSAFVTKARYRRAKSEMVGMSTMIIGARITDEKTLQNLTGNGCTACYEGWAIGNATAAFTGTSSAMTVQSWRVLGFESNPKDPWGGYYVLDENEGEFNATDCRPDMISSAGPNGIAESADYTTAGDDAVLRIQTLNPACAPLYSGAERPGYYGW